MFDWRFETFLISCKLTRGLNMLKKLSVMLVIVGLMSCVGCEEAKKTPKEIVRPVRYKTVEPVVASRQKRFTGVSKAAGRINLSFKVSGTMLETHFSSGDAVKPGDVLARIDDKDFRLQLDKAQASLAQTKVSVQTAAATLERTRKLFESNTAPLSQYEAAKETFAAAEAQFKTQEKAVQLMKRELGYYTLLSPIAGIVASTNGSVNENIAAGQVVHVLHGADNFDVTTGLPEQYITKTAVADRVIITFPTLPDKTYEGIVTEVGVDLDRTTMTYPVTIHMEKPDASIRTGMSAMVEFAFGGSAEPEGVEVPIHAVGKDDSGHFVFVVQASEENFGTVQRRSVVIGKTFDVSIEIVEGLTIGEKVVTAGVEKISNGMKVRLQ